MHTHACASHKLSGAWCPPSSLCVHLEPFAPLSCHSHSHAILTLMPFTPLSCHSHSHAILTLMPFTPLSCHSPHSHAILTLMPFSLSCHSPHSHFPITVPPLPLPCVHHCCSCAVAAAACVCAACLWGREHASIRGAAIAGRPLRRVSIRGELLNAVKRRGGGWTGFLVCLAWGVCVGWGGSRRRAACLAVRHLG
jgi:hypothetical protein